MPSLRKLLIPGLVAAGLVVGFSREVLLGYFFGISTEIEIFRVAFGLPSIISDGLSVSFSAILIRLILGGEKGRPAQALRQAVWAATLFAGVFFLIGVLTMPWQAQLLAPGMSAAAQAQLVVAGRVCWLMFFLVILSLPMRALMSTRGRIWPGAASQLLRSGGFVLALVTLVLALGWRDLMSLSAAAATGGAIVLAGHVLALGPRDRRRIIKSLGAPPVPQHLLPTFYALGAVLVSQLLLSGGRILDRAFVSGMSEGTLASLEYSYALLMAVSAFMATSANLTLAPRMGRAIRDTGRLARAHVLQTFVVAAAAAVVGAMLALFAEPITRLVFERGAFDSAATAMTSGIFRIHAMGLGPLVLSLLLTQVLLLQGRQQSVILAAAFKLTVKLVALWWVVSSGGGILDVALTLVWTEVGMALFLAALIWLGRQRPPVQPARA